MLRNSAGFAGSALVAQFFPANFLSAGVPGLRQQAATAPTDRLAAMRAQMGSAPIQSQPLAEIQRGHRNARFSGEIPVESVTAEFSAKFGSKIVVLENMENEAAA